MIDYHDRDWPEQVRAITEGRGVPAAVNAVPGSAADAIRAVADNGRLATITSDPPAEERGITVSNVYVRPDGSQLRKLAEQFADGTLAIPIAVHLPPRRCRRSTRPDDQRPRRRRHHPQALAPPPSDDAQCFAKEPSGSPAAGVGTTPATTTGEVVLDRALPPAGARRSGVPPHSQAAVDVPRRPCGCAPA